MLYPLAAANLLGGPLGRSSFAPVTEPPSAGLWAWWKADAIIGLADGAAVSAWPDSGPSGRNLSQATAGLRPTFRAGALAGKPVVEFDGADDYLDIASPAALTAGHIFVVANLTDATGTDKTIISGSVGSFAYQLQQTSGKPIISSLGFTIGAATAAPALATWFQANGSLSSGGAFVHRLNRAANGSGTVANQPTANITRVGDVGAFGPRAWKGRLAEILLYSAPLSAGDLAQAEAYLNYRWGV